MNKVIIFTPHSQDSDKVTAEDSDSVEKYGERGKIYNIEYITSEEEGQSLADKLINELKDPQDEGVIILSGEYKYDRISSTGILLSPMMD